MKQPETDQQARIARGDSQRWIHRPAHQFAPGHTLMVTAGTYLKTHHFKGPDRLQVLQDILIEAATSGGWRLEAWAVFSNHCHFIAIAPDDPKSLKALCQRIHSQSAREVNRLDSAPGRKVWFQFWDTILTHEKSYFARLNYVNQKAVKHGLVREAECHPFCSAGWFAENAEPGFRRKVDSFRHDQISVVDEFDC